MKKVSMRDVAAAAEVSVATVSLVLSGKTQNRRVSPQIIERVETVAAKMNYRPNRLALNFRNGHTQTVGLLVADISNPFFGSLAYYIQDELEQAGYAVIIMNTDEDKVHMHNLVTLLMSRQVDGFIIVPSEHSEDTIQMLYDNKIPTVLVDRPCSSVPVSSVCIDNYQVTYQATQFLLDKSCKRIAYFMYESSLQNMIDRQRGYEEAMREHALFDETLVRKVHYKSIEQDMVKHIDELLNGSIPVDGFFFSTNSIAIKGMCYLMKRGMSIGKDIQIVSYDKNDLTEIIPHLIAYIEQPIEQMGRGVAKLLLDQLVNGKESVQQLQLEAVLRM